MPFVYCSECHARYRVPASVAGRRARCKKCGQMFVIPRARPPDSGRLTLTRLDDPDAEQDEERPSSEQ